MLRIKRGSASGKQLRSILFVSGSPPETAGTILNQLPGDIQTWRVPGETVEADEEIWIKLEKVFRDAGFTLWSHALSSILKICDYPSSSGFGYAIPSRGIDGVLGSLRKLRQFEYSVCYFYLSIRQPLV